MRAALALGLLLSGCAGVNAALDTPDRSVPAGRDVNVILRNYAVFSRLGSGVLPCTAWLEREGDKGWAPVKTGDHVCITLLKLTPPSSHVDFTFSLPDDLEAGRYRVCTEASDEGPFASRKQGWAHLCTEAFDVTARIR